MTSAGSVAEDGTIRLFLALRLPGPVLDVLEAWGTAHLLGGRVVSRENLHITLAFLGYRPAADIPGILGVLREEAAVCLPSPLEPVRYRETRGVGMVAFDDPTGAATALAGSLHDRLEARGRPPPFPAPGFRAPPRRPPPLPQTGTFVPSDAAAYVSRLHPSGA